MSASSLLRLLRLPGSFLLAEAADIETITGSGKGELPLPQRIFLEDEDATPVSGFPVLLNESSAGLRRALESYVREESAAELDRVRGLTPNRRRAEVAS